MSDRTSRSKVRICHGGDLSKWSNFLQTLESDENLLSLRSVMALAYVSSVQLARMRLSECSCKAFRVIVGREWAGDSSLPFQGVSRISYVHCAANLELQFAKREGSRNLVTQGFHAAHVHSRRTCALAWANHELYSGSQDGVLRMVGSAWCHGNTKSL